MSGVYLGQGSYFVPFDDLVDFYVREEDIVSRLELRKLLKNQSLYTQNESQNNPILEEFESNQRRNMNAAIKRQVEFYFGDSNYFKDGFLKGLAN